jgi:hypothetical protein
MEKNTFHSYRFFQYVHTHTHTHTPSNLIENAFESSLFHTFQQQ